MSKKQPDKQPAKGAVQDRGESVGLLEPLLISETSRHRAALTDLALELAQKSAGFRRSLPPGLTASLASLVRAMNCYYSNLIEGHDTHPIDIERARTRAGSLPPLMFAYSPAPARVIDNGHTVEVDIAGGSTLTVGSKRYSLVQFHFHRPSEEVVDGHRFAMVAHLVHRDPQGPGVRVGAE